MPLISTKGVYGLAAMYELSRHNDETPMQIRDISANATKTCMDICHHNIRGIKNRLNKEQRMFSRHYQSH